MLNEKRMCFTHRAHFSADKGLKKARKRSQKDPRKKKVVNKGKEWILHEREIPRKKGENTRKETKYNECERIVQF